MTLHPTLKEKYSLCVTIPRTEKDGLRLGVFTVLSAISLRTADRERMGRMIVGN